MKTLVETSVSTDNGASRVGPGQRLRIVREQANISVDAIAARLHLRTDIISSIEADHYPHPQSFVFIKGYIRAYAKILGLNGDELINMFNELGLDESESKRTIRQFRRTQDWDNQHRQWKWGALLTLFSLVVMVLIWWQANKTATEETVTATATPVESTTAIPTQAATPTQPTIPTPSIAPTTPAPSTSKPAVSAQQEPPAEVVHQAVKPTVAPEAEPEYETESDEPEIR